MGVWAVGSGDGAKWRVAWVVVAVGLCRCRSRSGCGCGCGRRKNGQFHNQRREAKVYGEDVLAKEGGERCCYLLDARNVPYFAGHR